MYKRQDKNLNEYYLGQNLNKISRSLDSEMCIRDSYCCGCFSFTASLALSHFFIDNEYPGDIRFYVCDCV